MKFDIAALDTSLRVRRGSRPRRRTDAVARALEPLPERGALGVPHDVALPHRPRTAP